MRRNTSITLLVVCVLFSATFALAGCGIISAVTGSGQEQEQEREPDPLRAVEVLKINASDIRKEMAYIGRTAPGQTATVVSKLTGRVSEVMFDVGDRVVAGDILFRLDNQDMQNQINQLNAQLNQTELTIKTAENGLRSVTGGQYMSQVLQQETSIANYDKQIENATITMDNAQLVVDNAKLALDNAEVNYDSMKALYEGDVVTKSDFDRTELAYNQAKAAYEQAQNAFTQANIGNEQLTQAKSRAQEALSLTKGQIVDDGTRQAELAIEQARASKETVLVQLDILEKNMADITVTCPIDGVISSRNVKPHEFTTSQLPAFTIANVDTVVVEVGVSEVIINSLNLGDEVDVYIDSVKREVFEGVISSISPVADQTSAFPVKIEIENADGAIKPGMFAEVRFVKEHSENTVVVPRNTVISNVSESYVYLSVEGVAKRVPVILGIDNGKDIELLSGVSAGDLVIVKGQSYVSDGEELNVIAVQEGA